MKTKTKTFDWVRNQLHAGENPADNNSLHWHTNTKGEWWCGWTGHFTTEQLRHMCATTLRDLAVLDVSKDKAP